MIFDKDNIKISEYNVGSIIDEIEGKKKFILDTLMYLDKANNMDEYRRLIIDLEKCDECITEIKNFKLIDNKYTTKLYGELNKLHQAIEGVEDSGRLRDAIEKMINTLKGHCLVNHFYYEKFQEVSSKLIDEMREFKQLVTTTMTSSKRLYLEQLIVKISNDTKMYHCRIVEANNNSNKKKSISTLGKIGTVGERLNVCQPPGTKVSQLLMQVKRFLQSVENNKDNDPRQINEYLMVIDKLEKTIRELKRDTKQEKFYNTLDNLHEKLGIIADQLIQELNQEDKTNETVTITQENQPAIVSNNINLYSTS